MPLKTMQDLFISELKDLYSAETQILKALPKMAKSATSQHLRDALNDHHAVSEQQRDRLEEIARQLDVTPRGKKCKGVEGLIEEGSEMMKEHGDPAVIDAAIIAAAQRIEHYEISAYGTARTFARSLGMNQAAELLQQTLDEESATDKQLTDLAESEVNREALAHT